MRRAAGPRLSLEREGEAAMEKRQSRRESTARRDERGQRSCRTGPTVAAMPVLVCVGEGRPIGERRTGARVHVRSFKRRGSFTLYGIIQYISDT